MIFIKFTYEESSWKNDRNFFNKSVYISLPSELCMEVNVEYTPVPLYNTLLFLHMKYSLCITDNP